MCVGFCDHLSSAIGIRWAKVTALTVDLLSDMGYGVHLAHPRGNDWGSGG